jgi:hypothetical protein
MGGEELMDKKKQMQKEYINLLQSTNLLHIEVEDNMKGYNTSDVEASKRLMWGSVRRAKELMDSDGVKELYEMFAHTEMERLEATGKLKKNGLRSTTADIGATEYEKCELIVDNMKLSFRINYRVESEDEYGETWKSNPDCYNEGRGACYSISEVTNLVVTEIK